VILGILESASFLYFIQTLFCTELKNLAMREGFANEIIARWVGRAVKELLTHHPKDRF